MDSSGKNGETSIKINEGVTKAKAPAVIATSKATQQPAAARKRGIAVLDFIFRLLAVGGTVAAAAIMATTQDTLPFFTQFFQFQAQYNDIEAFVAFMIANAIVSGYLILSLPFSVVCIVRPLAIAPRLLLLIFDSIMMWVTTAAAGAAASIVYLAHNGNPNANWQAICQQFGTFCQSVSGAVVASFLASGLLLLLVILSALALKRDY